MSDLLLVKNNVSTSFLRRFGVKSRDKSRLPVTLPSKSRLSDGTRYHRRHTTPIRAEWLGSTCSRHDKETDDECVGLPLKQGVFPKHDHHQQLV